MGERSRRSVRALLGLLLAAVGACAEQHHNDSRAHGDGDGDSSSATQTDGGAISLVPNPFTPVGLVPAREPSSLPAQEPFDPLHTGCSSPRASEGVWRVFNELSHTCDVDEDCFVTAGAVSCSTECASGSLNVAERPKVERLLAAVEDMYCPPYRKASCPVLTPAKCDSANSLPRCVDHVCSSVSQGCAAGCQAERPGSICRGAAPCDGCPSVIVEAHDVLCSNPGQTCGLNMACAPYLECKEKEPGVFRWELYIPLC